MEKPTRCIIDNFLPTDELEEIEDLIYSQIFPWNTMNAVYEGDPDKRMVHMLRNELITSEYFKRFEPIFRELRLEYVSVSYTHLTLPTTPYV